MIQVVPVAVSDTPEQLQSANVHMVGARVDATFCGVGGETSVCMQLRLTQPPIGRRGRALA